MGFRGGYNFKNFEGAAEPVLRVCAIPKSVFIPTECSSIQFTPLVENGDLIRAGQRIFEADDGTAVYLVSPVNGTIKNVTGKGITIAADGTTNFEPVEGHTRAPWHLERENIFEVFRSSGCVVLLDGHFSSVNDLDRVMYIIVNAVHNAPLNKSWTPGMAGDPFIFPNGLKTLRALFPDAEITIAINKRNKKYFDTPEINSLATVRVMSGRYPQEHPELLSRDAIRQRLVSLDGIRDNSILVIPFFDVIQTAEIMTLGHPFINRILMIAGPGVSNPGWYRVRIGTPFEEIRHHLCKSEDRGPWRIIRGNLFDGESIQSMTASIHHTDTEISVIREQETRELFRFMNPGFTWDNYPKISAAEYIPFLPKLLDSSAHGGERPCVQCNYCDEVCPVGIYPFLIWKYVQAERAEESFRFKPFDCIGCGLCDYVCPSKISLTSSVRIAKEAYRESRRADEVVD